ncbi:MAG: bifunctional phosphopantothenoylcysteine decarboxylase/phosphopantothenate--cysteine ligase CoaBC, partial [Pseudomonadales bacterium]|nr:bifunctional phosphopantothenoylcysteine decarboxylase/phosphopantothenate--cysteine ligase CoaBC [Pseudomonadales bacterium]
MQALTNKRILLGVTGGIAAYKSAELIRRLQDQGADVRVVMTRAATEFITPLTMQALSGHPVHLDLLDSETESVMGHIELARWADVILIAPASANFIARLQAGQGDDLLTTICLAAECRIALAPAMNQAMWAKASTRENCESLLARGCLLFGPDEGIQACGEVGPGRMLDVGALVEQTIGVFPSTLLTGRKVVITAGPTREALDPVRYISNHSSGKQGFALAEAAVEAGASVTLISGPVHLETPDRVNRIDVVSADQMYDAVMQNIEDCDIFIGVAAVADYKP